MPSGESSSVAPVTTEDHNDPRLTEVLRIRVDEELHSAVEELARRNERSTSAEVRLALRLWVDNPAPRVLPPRPQV